MNTSSSFTRCTTARANISNSIVAGYRPRRSTTTVGLVAGALLLPGCAAHKIAQPTRAIWVTRFDYETADDVTRIMENCADAGFDAVLFQVRGNGTVAYRSRIEPWAEQFDHADPGFDPLVLAIREAHERGLQLHAWVNVMPAWRGPDEPTISNQLYFTHPDWFWYDADGRRQPLVHQVGDNTRGWYASLNPCLPEVRDYLVDVFEELVTHYNVDGLHMDYIRFPNEPVVSGEKIPDYPRDARTLELYAADTGQTPDDDPEAWTHWRSEQVTRLVGDIHAMMRRRRPDALLSAAVGSVPENALKHFQDTKTWIRDGIIDTVFLMNYTGDLDKFRRRLDPWLAEQEKTPIIPGLWFDESKPGEEGAEIARQQIESARQATGGFCVFAYSSLFDSANREFNAPNEALLQKRAARRDALLPYLRSLAAGGNP